MEKSKKPEISNDDIIPLGVPTEKCKICNSPIGLEWTQMLQHGEIDRLDMADKFGVPLVVVDDHLLNHHMEHAIENRKKFSEIVKDPDYLYDELHYIINRLKHWLDSLDEDEPDLQTIKQGATLIKEFRETIKFVADLEGKFNRGDTYHQQFIQIQGDYNQFTNMVLEHVCPACQLKLSGVMDAAKKE